MGYRLLFLFFFFYTFAIQGRMVSTPLTQVPVYAGLASWLLIVMQRKAALYREIKYLQKQIKAASR